MIVGGESGKHPLSAGLAGVFPPVFPCVRQFAVFIRAVVQFFALTVRLVSAAKSVPVTSQACGVTHRNIVKGTTLSKPDEMTAFRIVEAVKRNSFILRDVADTIVAHASVSWRGKQQQGDDEMLHENSLEAISGNVKRAA